MGSGQVVGQRIELRFPEAAVMFDPAHCFPHRRCIHAAAVDAAVDCARE